MGLSRRLRWLAVLAALALVLAACGGDGDEGDGGTEEGEGGAAEEEAAAGGEYSIYLVEPEHLIPTDTAESEGAEVDFALYKGLIEYDVETSEPIFDGVAESIEPNEDSTVWTITLKEGWTFHNGEPVDAQAYVDTWNFAAYAPNAQDNGYFMDKIQGYDEVSAEDATVTELSGLEAVDERTIQVTLTEPFSQFGLTLGYTAFYPMPSSSIEELMAIEDHEERAEAISDWEQEPIGNGPYMMDGPWQHDQTIRVVRFPDYGGEAAVADAIEFRIYADLTTAYNDLLAGNLDIIDDLPNEQLAGAADTFGDRLITRDSSSFTYIGFPLYDERFSDVRVRQAFSMAIDRQAIIDAIFNGAFEPAGSYVSPVVVGSRDNPCGEPCQYDPEAAAALLEEAGGWEGPLVLWLNSGSDHEIWIEAVANQLRENLGIQDITFNSLEFAEYLPLLEEGGVDGPFRLGWSMDYPSPQNYLESIYETNASSNYTFYDNAEFNDLIAQGNQAPSIDEGVEFYNQAEDVLLADLPSIPMWFETVNAGYSENITNVQVDAFERVRSDEVEVVNP